eukprot:gene11203-23910_t
MPPRAALPAALAAAAGAAKPPHVLFIVGDDVGYNDIGHFNGKKTITPTMDGLIESGIVLSDYYTFKICSPSRAAMLTGRYPWAAGFYDMSMDTMLKPLGYRTHALGKWDVGFMAKKCSATFRGFDTFLGYYAACEADYWYHGASGGYPTGARHYNNVTCTDPARGSAGFPVDLSNNTGGTIGPVDSATNGTYNTRLLAAEPRRLVTQHDPAVPFYMYLAFMAVHGACEGGVPPAPFKGLAHHAPLATVELYNTTALDTHKVLGAMYTELDRGIASVVAALGRKGMWDSSVLVFVSDNGGPLPQGNSNHPLRGGKHTFFEGGVRVAAFVSGPLIPRGRRGSRWSGMAASADWYKTIVEGIAGGSVPATTGTRPPDALDLWPAILD